jgi:hypothetical protein
LFLGGQRNPFPGGQHTPFSGGHFNPFLGGQHERFFQPKQVRQIKTFLFCIDFNHFSPVL